jgi:hypothetical protein
MSDEEAATRWKALHAHVNNQTAQKFVTDFITRCVRANYKHRVRETLVIPELDPVAIKAKYQAASRRLILIDLEKTMWKVEPRPCQKQVFEVPAEAVELLKKLAVGNEVWALSGLPVEGRLESIAREIPSIGIWWVHFTVKLRIVRFTWLDFSAEHGCFVKPPGHSQWVNLIEGFSLEWMVRRMAILLYGLTFRCLGRLHGHSKLRAWPVPFHYQSLTLRDTSLLSGLLGHSSKSAKQQSFGGSGPEIPITRMMKPGHAVKRRKHRTTFSIPLRNSSESCPPLLAFSSRLASREGCPLSTPYLTLRCLIAIRKRKRAKEVRLMMRCTRQDSTSS